MRRVAGCCVVLLVLAGPVFAAAPEAKSYARETWDAAYLEGARSGHVHTVVRQLDQDGQTVLHTTVELNLSVRRDQDAISLRMTTGSDETLDGKVVGISMRQFLGKDQQLVMTGTVENGELHVRVDGGKRLDKKIPWNDKVVGLYRQERLFREHKVRPGDHFTYLSYEPQVTAVLTNRVNVKDYEETEIPGTGLKQRLLRVEVTSEKIGAFQPPPLTTWLDDELNPVRSQFEIPGLGKLLLQRTTREIALRKGTGGRAVNIMQLLPINRRIPRPYATRDAVYRITVKGDDDPATTFARDGRQEVKNVRGDSFELHIHAVGAPGLVENPPKVGDEYLKSCYFINSDDAHVKEHARDAVGDETDPFAQARLIEKWVHDNMENKNLTEAFATADHVAVTLEGDCTEHAVLAAAMCRAVGIPSRAAVGLLYVDTARGPVMGFHMWAEAYVRGQWIPIDGTLGRGYVGATHLKISDNSWYDTQSLTPLLPVLRVLGKVAIEVISAE